MWLGTACLGRTARAEKQTMLMYGIVIMVNSNYGTITVQYYLWVFFIYFFIFFTTNQHQNILIFFTFYITSIIFYYYSNKKIYYKTKIFHLFISRHHFLLILKLTTHYTVLLCSVHVFTKQAHRLLIKLSYVNELHLLVRRWPFMSLV